MTVTIVAHISSGTPAGTLTDTANATSNTPDPNGTNNTATFNTTVSTSADLAVTKTGPANVTAGQPSSSATFG